MKKQALNLNANDANSRRLIPEGNPFKKVVVEMDTNCYAVYRNGQLVATFNTRHEANVAKV